MQNSGTFMKTELLYKAAMYNRGLLQMSGAKANYINSPFPAHSSRIQAERLDSWQAQTL